MGQLCCFPFSRGEEKIIFWQLLSINRWRQGPKCKDTIKELAFQKELKPLLDKVKDIKTLMGLPETRAKIYKELFGNRQITGSHSDSSIDVNVLG
ncbi:A-kinase anchoring protein 7 isoform 3-T3 [Anomaloglossus baeobatrachus]